MNWFHGNLFYPPKDEDFISLVLKSSHYAYNFVAYLPSAHTTINGNMPSLFIVKLISGLNEPPNTSNLDWSLLIIDCISHFYHLTRQIT